MRLLSYSSTLTTALPPRPFSTGPLLAATWGSVVAPGSTSCQQSWCLPPQALFWEPPVTHSVAAPVIHWMGLVCISAPHRSVSNRRNKLQDTAHSQQSKAPTPFFTYDVFSLQSCIFQGGNYSSRTMYFIPLEWSGWKRIPLILVHLPTSVKIKNTISINLTKLQTQYYIELIL